MTIKIGSRASKLAIIQAEIVAQKIKNLLSINSIIIPIKTTGDFIKDKNLYDIGGKALFLKEIESLLFDKTIDIAVHSLKDVPAFLPEGLKIAAVLAREDPREMLVSNIATKITDLPVGATIGTSSIRRQVQLLKLRPDLNIVPFRGNVDSRLNKVMKREVDTSILAAAGLKRLNYKTDLICNIIPQDEILPAIGQGVIAIEVREDDQKMLKLCSKINHQLTWQLIKVERGYLETLNASCKTPVGGIASFIGNGYFKAQFMLGDYDMKYFFRFDTIEKLEHGHETGIAIAKKFLQQI